MTPHSTKRYVVFIQFLNDAQRLEEVDPYLAREPYYPQDFDCTLEIAGRTWWTRRCDAEQLRSGRRVIVEELPKAP